MNTNEITGLTGYTTAAHKFGNKHGERTYPAGTLVEITGAITTDNGWTTARVVGKRSIKGWVRLNELTPA